MSLALHGPAPRHGPSRGCLGLPLPQLLEHVRHQFVHAAALCHSAGGVEGGEGGVDGGEGGVEGGEGG